jgi:hypothetical protein
MKKLLFILIPILFAFQLFGQITEIRGFVYDKQTGEPIIFTNVYLKGTTYGASTNMDGFYSMSKIPEGNYTLMCTNIGYDTFQKAITLKKGKIINQTIYLNPGSINLKTFTVTGKKKDNRENVKVSKIKVTPIEIEKLPSITGTPDAAEYIKILPGVVSSGDKGGQIYIRGGTPIQNKVILDGMTIYNPFHSIGLFSVFDIDMIKSIDVYAGGFDAEYGDRISAIMDVKSADGNKTRLSGRLGASPFASKLVLTGPLKKWETNKGSSTFLLSGRTSYLDKTAPVLYDYADSTGLPYSFTDLYGKVTFTSREGSNIKFFGFNFNDKVDFEGITSYNWGSRGMGTQFLLIPTNTKTIVEGRFSFSNYGIEQQEADNRPRSSNISGFEGGMTFTNFLGRDKIRFGFELSGFKTDFKFFNAAGRTIQQIDNSTNMAAFFKYKRLYDNLVIEPSLRLTYFASLQESVLEPRFGAKYNVLDILRLKIAGGLYSQNFISSFSDRDVVNYFYGFLSSPDGIPNNFDGKEVTTRLQKAWHAIFGVELDLGEFAMLNSEAYLKKFTQLTNINRNKIFDNTPDFQDKPEYLRSDYILENGDAYGLNFHFTYERLPFYIWIVYDLAWVERYDGIDLYTPNWDRRHNLQMLLNYTLGTENPVEISGRWNYGSGFPFTQTQGFYEFISFQNGINQDYTTTNGELGILYASLNGGRLPDYHRLDFSIKKTFNFTKYQVLDVMFTVTNVYDRDNIFYYDRVKSIRIDQLPILPSVGAYYSF